MKSPAGQRLALGLLLLLPPTVLVAVLLHRSVAPQASSAAATGPGELSTSRWPNGRPKQTVRDWTEGRTKLQERCAFEDDGSALGCAVLKDGEPWDGVLVDFASPEPAAEVVEVRRFDHGRRTGVWRTYLPGGEVAGELVYDDDRLLSRKSRDGQGVLRPTPEPAARLPGGTLPRFSFPPKSP